MREPFLEQKDECNKRKRDDNDYSVMFSYNVNDILIRHDNHLNCKLA